MSIIRDGKFIRSDIAKYANGGTEYMAETIEKHVPKDLLSGVDIYISRVDKRLFDENRWNILYVHDMGADPMYDDLNFDSFDKIVFVSAFQMASMANKHRIPYEKCLVIPNCISLPLEFKRKTLKNDEEIRFIYHTTPHRGLEELVYGFDQVLEVFPKAKLSVFSSFNLYGWKERDKQYEELFNLIKKNRNMVYRGNKPRQDLYKEIPKHDVFFYPCKWPETSCISLIEAARAGLLCVVPEFSALGETSKYPNTIRYNPSQGTIKDIMEAVNNYMFKDGTWTNENIDPNEYKYHSLEYFIQRWEDLIMAGPKWKI